MDPDDQVDPFGWVGNAVAGKYRVDELVAEGGFGVVYRAQHLGFDSRVALKCLKLPAKLEGEAREKFLAAFVAEGKLLHQLSRETVGIVQALDAGAETSPSGTWTPYIALEWLEGTSLSADLRARKQDGLPVRTLAETIALLEPAAGGLAVAHQRGVVHRDIKPANLFLARLGDRSIMKVVDFGIAKVMTETNSLTRALESTGATLQAFTPSYGAPEQFDRVHYGATGPWTDVFALALVVVELVSGRHALDGEDATQLFISAIHPDRRPTPRTCGVAVSDSVEAVMLRAVAVEARNRFASAGEFWDALVRAASDGTAAREPTAIAQSAALALALAPAPAAGETRKEGASPVATTAPATAREAAQAPASQDEQGMARQSRPPAEPAAAPSPSAKPSRRLRGLALVSGGTAVVAGGLVAVFGLFGQNEAGPAAATSSSASTTATANVRHYVRALCGSIDDSASGLEWFIGQDQNTSWEEASTWTAALTVCGGGWRMPSAEELNTLYDPRHTAGRGYDRDGKHFPAKLDPIFADIGGGSSVWSNAQPVNKQAVAYEFFAGGTATIPQDGTTPGLPQFTTRAFAVRGHGRTADPPRDR
jgi:serine/threonine protein kinase